MNTDQNSARWYNYIFLFFGLFGFVVSLTILYFGMRSVMDIGGYCAEGGPYQIEVHCPEGVAWMMPLSIFSMMFFALMYVLNVVPRALNFTYLFWTALFGALGWNFLDYGVIKSDPIEVSWLICGVIFMLMAFGPYVLFVLVADDLKTNLSHLSQNLGLKIALFIYQLIAIALGIWAGVYVFFSLT